MGRERTIPSQACTKFEAEWTLINGLCLREALKGDFSRNERLILDGEGLVRVEFVQTETGDAPKPTIFPKRGAVNRLMQLILTRDGCFFFFCVGFALA